MQNIKDPDLIRDILKKAPAHNVGRFFCNSTSVGDWDSISGLAAEHGAVVPFFGIHPWYITENAENWEEKLRVRLDVTPSGIGEIGLDRAHKDADPEIQKRIFIRQLDLAVETGRPFVLHSVDSWGLILDELRWRRTGRLNFMAHAFSGPREILLELLVLGAYISFSLKSFQDHGEKTKKIFPFVPLDRLLLESDLPGPGLKNETTGATADNYFSGIQTLYALAAEAKRVEKSDLEEAVWKNGSVFMH